MEPSTQSSPRRFTRPSRLRARRLAALAATGAVFVGLTGCGSDDNSSAAAAPAATDSAPAATEGAAPATADTADTTAAATDATAASNSAVTDSAAPATDPMVTDAPADTTARSDSSTTGPLDTAATGDSTVAAPADAPIANAITITTPGMSYDVSGPLQPGVAAITLHNADDESHMMAVGRLKPGVTLDQLRDALKQGEDAAGALLADGPDASVYGTPAPVGPGQSSTVTATDLQPGDYGIICFFTTDDGTPHFTMGMVDTFTVAGQPATETPTSDGTVTIDDAGMQMPDGFTGIGTYLVTNDGTTPHSISIARLDDGTTLDAYYQFVGGQMNSSKSIDGGGGVLVGGVDSLLPGQSAYLTLDLPHGHYGYLSIDDANSPSIPVQSGEFDVS